MLRRLFLPFTLLLLSVTAGKAEAAGDPAAFLEQFGREAIAQLADENVPYEQRQRQFQDMLDRGFDLEAIARFIIARPWRSAEESERQAFVEVFKDYLTQRFLPLFEGYTNGEFSTGGVRVDQDNENLSWVRVTFEGERGQPVQTDWRLRRNDGEFRILDVRAEGASMALTLREEYASVMRQEGGLGGLVARLEEQVERGAFRPN